MNENCFLDLTFFRQLVFIRYSFKMGYRRKRKPNVLQNILPALFIVLLQLLSVSLSKFDRLILEFYNFLRKLIFSLRTVLIPLNSGCFRLFSKL
jgi:hypothetical protein